MLEIEYRQLGMSPYRLCILLVLMYVTEYRNESKANDSTVGVHHTNEGGRRHSVHLPCISWNLFCTGTWDHHDIQSFAQLSTLSPLIN